jgi:SAM-dependent methyltransferase
MPIKLYAGDVPDMPEYAGLTGLSLRQKNDNHIKHDVTKRHPFKDNSVNSYQSEDVFEHIEYNKIADIINDIYRILKPGGLFRLSLPDYRCDVLRKRSVYEDGEIVFDPFGGGFYQHGQVLGGGHLWFPKIESVRNLLFHSHFDILKCKLLHYYDTDGTAVTNEIDYKLGYVQRTPDHDIRVQKPYRPMSIVIDFVK